MSLGAEISADVLEILDELGSSLTYERMTNGTYNPQTSTGSRTPSSFPIKGTVEDLHDEGRSFGLSNVAHKKISTSALPFGNIPPKQGDKVTGLSKGYLVVDYDSIPLGDDLVMYVLFARRG